MRVLVGTFASRCLEARFGDGVEAAVEERLRDYAEWGEDSSPSLPVPKFWLARGADGDEQVELEVRIDSRTRRLLERRAAEKGVAFDQLITHVIFLAVASAQWPDRSALAQGQSPPRRRRPPGPSGPTLELSAAPRRQRR